MEGIRATDADWVEAIRPIKLPGPPADRRLGAEQIFERDGGKQYEISGANFVSLQKDGPAAQAADPSNGLALHDITADLHDFEDTAALIVNLDLVITVDTAVAHLAARSANQFGS